MQTAVEGIVKGNTVIVRNDLRRFDGRRVRVTLLDAKKRSHKALEGLFGLWKNHDNSVSVGETVRNLRKGRRF